MYQEKAIRPSVTICCHYECPAPTRYRPRAIAKLRTNRLVSHPPRSIVSKYYISSIMYTCSSYSNIMSAQCHNILEKKLKKLATINLLSPATDELVICRRILLFYFTRPFTNSMVKKPCFCLERWFVFEFEYKKKKKKTIIQSKIK